MKAERVPTQVQDNIVKKGTEIFLSKDYDEVAWKPQQQKAHVRECYHIQELAKPTKETNTVSIQSAKWAA